MKQIYQCEICGAMYDTEIEAESCEERHRAPVNVESVTFEEAGIWPLTVILSDKHGHAAEYEFLCSVADEEEG